jgi:hypothetical protein
LRIDKAFECSRTGRFFINALIYNREGFPGA